MCRFVKMYVCVISTRYCFEQEQQAEGLVVVLSLFSFVLFTLRVLDSTQNYECCHCSGCHINCSNVGNLRSHLLSAFLHDHFPGNNAPMMVCFKSNSPPCRFTYEQNLKIRNCLDWIDLETTVGDLSDCYLIQKDPAHEGAIAWTRPKEQKGQEREQWSMHLFSLCC